MCVCVCVCACVRVCRRAGSLLPETRGLTSFADVPTDCLVSDFKTLFSSATSYDAVAVCIYAVYLCC